jgi:hypothetical protein
MGTWVIINAYASMKCQGLEQFNSIEVKPEI